MATTMHDRALIDTAVQDGALHDRALNVLVEAIGPGALLIHLNGRLDVHGVLWLRQLLRRTAIVGPRVVLDLAGVPEIDDRTYALLVKTQRGLRRQGGGLGLWHLRTQPRRVMEEMKLCRVLDVVPGDLDAWLAAAVGSGPG